MSNVSPKVGLNVGDMDVSGFNDIVNNVMTIPNPHSATFSPCYIAAEGNSVLNSIDDKFVNACLSGVTENKAVKHVSPGFTQRPESQGMLQPPLTRLDTNVQPHGVTRYNSMSLTHVLSALERRRIESPCWGQPNILPGTTLYAVGSYDDRAKENYLVVGDTKAIRRYNANAPDKPITSYIRLSAKQFCTDLHPRIVHGHQYLFCAMGLGSLEIFQVDAEGNKHITPRVAFPIQDGYIRQLAFCGDLIASGGETKFIKIHNCGQSADQPVPIFSINLNGGQMSSVSFSDNAASIRYTIEGLQGTSKYEVADLRIGPNGMTGSAAVSIGGLPDGVFCHLNLTEHLVALSGLDHTIRVRDIRKPNFVCDELVLDSIGAIGNMERNSAGTGFLVHGHQNVVTWRQMPGQNTAQIWSRLEEPQKNSSTSSYAATYANFPHDDQRTQDTILYADTVGNVGVITENYLFDKMPH